MTQSHTLIASNRLPITISHNNGKAVVKPGAGGLATALGGLPISQRTWVGYTGAQSSEEVAPDVRDALSEQNYVPVYVPEEEYKLYYEDFSNSILWLLFHYEPELRSFKQEQWDAYENVNFRFAQTIADVFDPNVHSSIFIQDYQLMMVPGFLRKLLATKFGSKANDVHISFFLHIPFPTSELFRACPRRNEILDSLLHCNQIGFHVHAYVRHFLSSCARVLHAKTSTFAVKYKGRYTWCYAYPIGIQPKDFSEPLLSDQGQQHFSELQNEYQNRHVIFSCDRVDPAKGLIEKLQAFRHLLETNPHLVGKVQLIQVAVPSRERIHVYKELVGELNTLVGDINGKFGTPLYQPCVYIHRPVPRNLLTALYAISDVCFISSLRDGQNLVSSEYVVCQEAKKELSACMNKVPGVLVLSEFAGAASSLAGSVLINPSDIDSTSRALLSAIEMAPSEKQARHNRNVKWICDENSIDKWFKRIITHQDLWTQLRYQLPCSSKAKPLDSLSLTTSYASAKERYIFLDYDGTCVGFHSNPSMAKPTPNLLEYLSKLSNDPKTNAFVISGRSRDDLDDFFQSVPGLGLVGEHGLCVKKPGSDSWMEMITEEESNQIIFLKETLLPYLQVITENVPGSFIEKKKSSLAWHYRSSDVNLADISLSELEGMFSEMFKSGDFEMLSGEKVVEFRTNLHNKGTAIQRILCEGSEPEFLAVFGDDVTDEKMFSVLYSDPKSFKSISDIESDANSVIYRLMKSAVSGFVARRDTEGQVFELPKECNVFTVKVGIAPTLAEYNIPSVEKVNQVLECLAAMSN
ncbi:hypothetical protein P9112_002112 [Eukaryota sp. TZLM1-RC]